MESTPKTAAEWAMTKIKEDGAGGLLTVTFPGWAVGVFNSTLSAANILGWSPSQVSVVSLAQWLDVNGYLTFTPPPEGSSLPADAARQLRSALRWAVTGADGRTKTEKDAALDEILPILRAVLSGAAQD